MSYTSTMKLECLVVLAFVLFASAVARKEIDPKGWIPIVKINDPALIEIAQFAVTEFNKEAGLTFK